MNYAVAPPQDRRCPAGHPRFAPETVWMGCNDAIPLRWQVVSSRNSARAKVMCVTTSGTCRLLSLYFRSELSFFMTAFRRISETLVADLLRNGRFPGEDARSTENPHHPIIGKVHLSCHASRDFEPGDDPGIGKLGRHISDAFSQRKPSVTNFLPKRRMAGVRKLSPISVN